MTDSFVNGPPAYISSEDTQDVIIILLMILFSWSFHTVKYSTTLYCVTRLLIPRCMPW